MSYNQQYRPTNNGYLQKPSFGARLGLDYEENKDLRHLPPSPVAVNVTTSNRVTHYQYVGGQIGYQEVYNFRK